MSLAPGARLGPYEITAQIGAGGMGEVWRATDTNLGRQVAIKVLPDAVAHDPDRLARFEREARTLASLNHPNIAAVHGLEKSDGSRALVMELVEGPTLADRLGRGPMSVDEALPVAKQIAEALEAAHERGIIHRDLKPANIKVRPDGAVKVLDFGLAKALDEEPGGREQERGGRPEAGGFANSPTFASPAMTQAGMILGTAAYMSPEQARGKTVDKRADIWAFGCVLYEMLAGKPAFTGDTLTDIVAAVLSHEPDWTALPAETPHPVRALLRRCLKKDTVRRLHDSADARIEIEEAINEPPPRPQAIQTARPRAALQFAGWLAAALLAIVLLVMRIGSPDPASTGPQVVRLELNMPPGVEANEANSPSVAISPDGTHVAFIGLVGGVRSIYIRRLGEFESAALRGTESANFVAFSPDGAALLFVATDRTLKKVSLSDGLVTIVVRDVDSIVSGGAWGPDGRITFVRDDTLWRVAATGGKPEQLTTLDTARGERSHLWPAAVADSGILFTSLARTDRMVTNIEAISLMTRERRVVIEAASAAHYAPSGHLLFFRDGVVFAAPFDVARLQVTGPAVAVLKDIGLDQYGAPSLSISAAGSLAYTPAGHATRRLVWVSRQGVEQPITDVTRRYRNPRLSPDGHRIMVEVTGELWIQDIARSTFTLLTKGDTLGNSFAVWTPNGQEVLFRTLTGIRRLNADGSGASQAIPFTGLFAMPTSVSPDGQTLVYIGQTAETAGDVNALSLQGEPHPRPVVRTPGYDGGGWFSPDGRWLAYVSNESGQFQVYLRPYPGPDRRVPVSTEGGTHPRWNPNGKELFYRNGNRMMAVDVSTSPNLVLSRPRVLFEQRYVFGGQTVANYDVSPDGQRFVMVKDDSASGRINLVLNWLEELKRLVPIR